MTKEMIEKLAREYAKKYHNYSAVKVETPTQSYWYYNSMIKDVIEEILRTYCIVSRERVKDLYNSIQGEIICAHDDDDWHSAAHYILDVMPREFTKIFGSELLKDNDNG